ncbi:GNAT family N-acetyltransferase [Camelimonas abortus]|uniref:GNAT family N-acetyltransferase n=1 Tax=Camelimonas abortus TaxID=1017184 RepID=A0ABV7LDY0_9HYPH
MDGDGGDRTADQAGATLRLRVAGGVSAIDAASWDACAGADNPFVSHAFFSALELSGSACAATGWLPLHLVAEDVNGAVAGIAPCYLKSHSMGEYVFDHGWARAFEQAGGSYYPKLQACVPFTPVTGPRLLARPGPEAQETRRALARGLVALRGRAGASSVHVTFPTAEDWRLLGGNGYLQRRDRQYHWFNEGYASFDDFLQALSSSRRKTIRRERREAVKDGLVIERLSGAEISEEAWDAFFAFYQDTGSRKWGRPYLTRDFYRRVAETMADRVLLVMARRAGRYVAGAINFIGADALYGRHWGCIEDHPFLHFEICYYQAIDYAIGAGLARVEAGAQGEHKLARGYRPVETRSAHAIAHPGLRRAVAAFLEEESRHIDALLPEMEALLPFRRSG